MENDLEIKGNGNSYDFGARMLDPRVGRWFAPDKFEAKYPNLSPYAYSGNNPILFKDIDGRDFIVVIDHKNKTITIKQIVFYKDEAAKKADQGAVTQWESFSAIYETKDGIKYNVDFDIDTVVLGTKTKPATNQEVIDKANEKLGNNAVLFLDDTTFKTEYINKGGEEDPDLMGGFTEGSNVTYNRASVANDNTNAHEKGHQFYLEDKENAVGTMRYMEFSEDVLKKMKGNVEETKKAYLGQLPVSEKNVENVIDKILDKIEKIEKRDSNKKSAYYGKPSRFHNESKDVDGNIKMHGNIKVKGEYNGKKGFSKGKIKVIK